MPQNNERVISFEELLGLAAETYASEQADELTKMIEELPEPEFSPEFEAKMGRLSKRSRTFWPRFGHQTRRAAAIVCLLVASAVFTMLATGNLMVPGNAIAPQVQASGFSSSADVPSCDAQASALKLADGQTFLPTYIPEGFSLESSVNAPSAVAHAYVGINGGNFTFTQKSSSEFPAELLTDEAVRQVSIGDCTGYISSSATHVLLVWVTGSQMFSLSSTTVSEEELVKVALSLRPGRLSN